MVATIGLDLVVRADLAAVWIAESSPAMTMEGDA
jgi:hypothetical protein